jgi:hypothetical protein
MIQFFKELYLTAFTLLYRIPGGNTYGKTTGSVTIITLMEWGIIVGIASWIDIIVGIKTLLSFSTLSLAICFFALYFVNYRVLVTRGHGIKFEHEFGNLGKSRRILLVATCAVLLFAIISFAVYSTLAHRRFVKGL